MEEEIRRDCCAAGVWRRNHAAKIDGWFKAGYVLRSLQAIYRLQRSAFLTKNTLGKLAPSMLEAWPRITAQFPYHEHIMSKL